MPAPEPPVPLSAVGLRLTDEVGQAVLDWVADGDLSAAAALDQHVAALRTALARCDPDDAAAARLAGQSAGRAAASRAGSSAVARSDPARTEACPDVPFSDSAWYADEIPPMWLLLHYACGFVEAAVRADWWPGESEPSATDFEAVRLAAVCRLIRLTEAAAALPPEAR